MRKTKKRIEDYGFLSDTQTGALAPRQFAYCMPREDARGMEG